MPPRVRPTSESSDAMPGTRVRSGEGSHSSDCTIVLATECFDTAHRCWSTRGQSRPTLLAHSLRALFDSAPTASMGSARLRSARLPFECEQRCGNSHASATNRGYSHADHWKRFGSTRGAVATLKELVRYWATDYDWRSRDEAERLSAVRDEDRRRGHPFHPRQVAPSERTAADHHARWPGSVSSSSRSSIRSRIQPLTAGAPRMHSMW